MACIGIKKQQAQEWNRKITPTDQINRYYLPNCKESNTSMRERQRINILFYFEYVFTFLDKYSITPFNKVTSYEYRRIFLNLSLNSFKNLLHFLTWPSLSSPQIIKHQKCSQLKYITVQQRYQHPHHRKKYDFLFYLIL